jgi:predicted AAA+ superfamily ATPase
MPHLRPRYAEKLISRALGHSPVVGVFGQRQVGKTTLLEAHCPGGYVTLDRAQNRLELEADPDLFVGNRPLGFAIDEAQLCPSLFPAIKDRVRTRKSPGQFLLSGSVRFTSRKAIRESLTGRIAHVEVLPFTIAEAHGHPLPDYLKELSSVSRQQDLLRIIDNTHSARQTEKGRDRVQHYLQTGGLPGICFFRAQEVRADRLQSQLDTLLNRDLRLVQATSVPDASLRELLAFLAKSQGVPFELNKAVRASQISAVTIKKLLDAYEALFLIRRVAAAGDLTRPTYFLEDQGMASWLLRRDLEEPSDLVRALYANLRQELFYRPERNGRIFQFRTKHHVEIPLVFEAEGVRIGVLPVLDREVRARHISTASAFLKKHPRHKLVIASAGDAVEYRSANLFVIPYAALC